MPEFIVDPIVEDELWAIWQFIAQDNPDAATRVANRLTMGAGTHVWNRLYHSRK
jgi:plasmid stabilization system protein ParE